MYDLNREGKKIVKGELTNMTWVWDKEKIWDADMNWTDDLQNTRVGTLSTELWELMECKIT